MTNENRAPGRQGLMQQSLGKILTSFPADHPSIGPYWRLMRLDRPVGSYLILWPTLAGLWLAADGLPSIDLLIIFVVGPFLMRSAGCAINDYLDCDLDNQVARTKNRPLARREIPALHALWCFVALCALGLCLVLLTNRLTMLMALVGAALIAIYPLLKRVSNLPQLWLGLAMNWGIIMAWPAATNSLSREIWVLYVGTIFWTVAYDTCYAMVDRADDLRAGIKSIAILFGELDRLMIGVLQALALCAFWLSGWVFDLGVIYQLCLVVVAVLFLYQQWLIRNRTPDGCFAAFLNTQWVGLAVFLGIALDKLL